MQIGVREFKGRLSELLNGDRPVVVTNNGRVVGEFTPASITAPTADRRDWLKRRLAARRRWQEETPDWRDRLAAEGMDDEGELFEQPTFR
jgi:antitoxin (DNA-binding transcriptional repressor) of toxin-antitoxin stability system